MVQPRSPRSTSGGRMWGLEELSDAAREAPLGLARTQSAVVFAGSLPRGVEEVVLRGRRCASSTGHDIPDRPRRGRRAERLGLEAEPNARGARTSTRPRRSSGRSSTTRTDFLVALKVDRRAGRSQRPDLGSEAGCYCPRSREDRQGRAPLRGRRPELKPLSVVGAGDVLLAGVFLAARLERRPDRRGAAARGRDGLGLGARGRTRALRAARGGAPRDAGHGRRARARDLVKTLRSPCKGRISNAVDCVSATIDQKKELFRWVSAEASS